MSTGKNQRADLSLVEDEIDIPKGDLVSRENPVAMPPEPASEGIVLNSRIAKLAAQLQPEETKCGIHFRVPIWLARMIDQRVHQLKAEGSRITKDAVAKDALMRYLGVTGPPQ